MSQESKDKMRASHQGEKNHFFGKTHSEETKKKISERAKERCKDPEYIKKLSEAQLKIDHLPHSASFKPGQVSLRKGVKLSDETKLKISHARKTLSPEGRLNLSKAQKKRISKYGSLNLDKLLSPESKAKSKLTNSDPAHRKAISDRLKGVPKTKEHIAKISGKNHYLWKDGKSYEPYCPKFNDSFKERARAFWEYRCVLCGELWKGGRKIHVHHIHKNKKMCCDGSPSDVVILCGSCHNQMKDREEYWERVFMNLIYNFYKGKSYFTQQEWDERILNKV